MNILIVSQNSTNRRNTDLRAFRLLLAIAGVVLAAKVTLGQNQSMGGPESNECSGLLWDSSSTADTGYANNEDLIHTLLPSIVGKEVHLTFIVFNLSLEGTGDPDRLYIHDGTSIDAPLIGAYDGTSLQDAIITPSRANLSGALTLHFVSNDVGIGHFRATVSCTYQCERPVPSLTSSMGNANISCLGVPIDLDGTDSYSPLDWVDIVEWIWTLDGEPLATTSQGNYVLGPLQTPYAAIGLVVVDETGCSSLTDASGGTLHTFEAPPIQWSIDEIPDTACAETSVLLSGTAILEPITVLAPRCYNALTSSTNNTLAMPLLINDAPEGAVITDPSELGQICINLEHSYMGDLVMKLTCPNGAQVTLFNQGGAGSSLGYAIDGDDELPIPGEGLTYCFSSEAELGLLAQASEIGYNTHLLEVPGQSWPVAPDTYSSFGSLDDLIGCPMNGTWTMRVVDLQAYDNGFVFYWCLDLDSPLPVGVEGLPPALESELPDSSFWSGSGVTNIGPGTASYTAGSSGPQDLTFSIIDPFGCIRDTSLMIVVDDPLILSLSMDEEGSICVEGPPGTTYSWTLNTEPLEVSGPCYSPDDNGGVLIVTGTTESGCNGQASLVVTGLEDLGMKMGSISVSPNPTTGLTTVRIPAEFVGGTLVAHGALGQVLFAERLLSTTQQLDLAGLAPQLIILRFVDATGRSVDTERLVLGR